ncbi:hypothetical protein F4821DRAFT_257737 [Hypoxylon rubiginosum]|uniref:Uncharacterized protein n=1 Tax=Hypoxylon rubiginosum TaxID=110542 RepID=A0ACC0D854_9PEZI|nr:hypothetical protein F4821DRAFT_257737 [Hypoxylon rubiginosum]
MPPKKDKPSKKREASSDPDEGNRPKKKGRNNIPSEPDEGLEVDRNATPALDKFRGVVLKNGQYQCKELKNDRTCNTRFKNTSKSISAHRTKIHKPTSKYQEDQRKGESYPCTYTQCDVVAESLNNFVSHIRNSHDFRGDSQPQVEASLKKAGAYPADKKAGDTKKANDEAEKTEDVNDEAEMEEADDESSDESSLFVEPADKPPNRDHDPDTDGGRGPGGASSGPILVEQAA